MPSTVPGPVCWDVPAVRADRPVVGANPTGSAARTLFVARTCRSSAPPWVPGLPWTCQSTGTRAIARVVIFALVEERNAPIEASSATPTATPAAVASRRPRRWASKPEIQPKTIMRAPARGS